MGRDPATVKLGRKGGKNGRKYLSEHAATASGHWAVGALWEKWRAENPEKAAASEERRRKRAAKKNVHG